jgi:radical SAM superfamily enzyme YgiQ (UPF0313 family)
MHPSFSLKVLDNASTGMEEEILRGRFAAPVKRVLLVNPPDIDAGAFNFFLGRIGRYANYPTYGIGMLASFLAEDGIDVRILNLNHLVLKTCHEVSGPEAFDYTGSVRSALETALQEFQPDLNGVSCMFSLSHKSTADVCRMLKELAPGVPLALGGVHVTNSLSREETRNPFVADLPGVDIFFRGEAELAFRDLIRATATPTPQPLAQVLFRTGNEIVDLGQWRRPDRQDLDRLPALDQLQLAELSDYGKIGAFHYLTPRGTRFATVLSNRGCRAQCSFCSVRSFNGVGVRVRSVESVVNELAEMEERYGIGHVVWLDDDFLFDKAHAMNLFNAIVRRGLKMTWDCSNGVIAAACTEEVVAGMAESGCLGLVLGVESGNPAMLRKMRKPGTVENFQRAAEILRRYPKINTRVFLMFGFPGETRRMMQDTYRLAKEMAPDWCIIQVVQPLPNTPLFDQMVAEGLIQPSDFQQFRYSLGYYGKLKDRPRNVMTIDFHDALDRGPLDEVPPAADLDDIWAFLNYYLNFERLQREFRPEKLAQQVHWLEFVTDLVTRDGAIALYYRGLLERRMRRAVSPGILERLEQLLADTSDWQEQFDRLGFSVEDLRGIHAACGNGAYAPFRESLNQDVGNPALLG